MEYRYRNDVVTNESHCAKTKEGFAIGKRIESLQALRALAFVGIFLGHAQAGVFEWSGLSVSVFFVLSGFLLYRSHRDTVFGGVRDAFLFAKKHVSKLYPLHIITMLYMLLLASVGIVRSGAFNDVGKICDLALKVLLNVTLTQSLTCSHALAAILNRVAWLLSTIAFLYLVFPVLRDLVKRMGMGQMLLACAGVLSLHILVSYALLGQFESADDIYTGITYHSPLFLVGDFFAGCCLGKAFGPDGHRAGIARATLAEASLLAVTALAHWCWYHMGGSRLQGALLNGTTRFIPLAVAYVWVFVVGGGMFTRVCNRPALVWLGDVSGYAFLIHDVIIRGPNPVAFVLHAAPERAMVAVQVVLWFALTLALSTLYDRWARGGWRRVG